MRKLLLVALLAFVPAAAGAAESVNVLSQSALTAELRACSEQGKGAGCLTSQQMWDIANTAILGVNNAVSAAGSGQGSATVLIQNQQISKVTGGSGGVELPVAVAGQPQILCNASGSTINIYPASGASINGGATNAAIMLTNNNCTALYAMSTTDWEQISSGGGGGSGTVNSGSSPAIAQYQGSSSTTVGPATMSGDATIASGGALTLATVNSSPGSTNCSSVTTNGKGLVTANSSGTCGGTPTFFVGAATNSSNAYSIASPTPSSYALTNQYVIRTVIPATNTGAATLNVNSTGAKPIVVNTGNGLAATVGGEIVSGSQYDFTYSTASASPCSSSCYVALALPASSVQAGTTQTISAAQWATWTVLPVTSSGQTLTLPASPGLAGNGGLMIMTIGQTVTITPNSGDSINGGTAGASITVAAGLDAIVIKSSLGNISVAPTAASALNIQQSYTAGQAVTPVAEGTQSSGGTLTMNFASGNYFTATFGAGNLTIANPSNILAGQCGWLALTQDSVGSRTVTWGSDWKWAAATVPTLSTGASDVDLISWCAISSSVLAGQLVIQNYH